MYNVLRQTSLFLKYIYALYLSVIKLCNIINGSIRFTNNYTHRYMLISRAWTAISHRDYTESIRCPRSSHRPMKVLLRDYLRRCRRHTTTELLGRARSCGRIIAFSPLGEYARTRPITAVACVSVRDRRRLKQTTRETLVVRRSTVVGGVSYSVYFCHLRRRWPR